MTTPVDIAIPFSHPRQDYGKQALKKSHPVETERPQRLLAI
jgi:hypothetical protein